MTVTIKIVGDREESVKYKDNCVIATIEEKLFKAYGPGILKQDGFGVDNETLSDGNYQYHLTMRATVEQPGKY